MIAELDGSSDSPILTLTMRHPSRRYNKLATRPHRRIRLLLLALTSPILLLSSLHASAFILRHANALGRRCTPDPIPHPSSSSTTHRPKIALVSLSAESPPAPGYVRSFRGVMEAVRDNKRSYASGKGYTFVDAGDLVDPSRPPNWSKIPAVRSHLSAFHWVFWNDADTVITNPDVSLEDVLRAAIGHDDFDASPDLVATEDVNGVNSGLFFVRASAWSEEFLDTWWNMTSFVRFGSTKSGDNAAMKQLIGGMTDEEFRRHVRIVPMQCLFNSYPWVPSWKAAYRLITSPASIWKGAYSDGDFMVHLAGLDEKRRWVTKILQEAKGVHGT